MDHMESIWKQSDKKKISYKKCLYIFSYAKTINNIVFVLHLKQTMVNHIRSQIKMQMYMQSSCNNTYFWIFKLFFVAIRWFLIFVYTAFNLYLSRQDGRTIFSAVVWQKARHLEKGTEKGLQETDRKHQREISKHLV